MIFYKHFIGDYQRDTGHLSILEHGVYRLLMDAYYATEKPLPADEKRIFRLLSATEPDEHEAVRTVLEEFWELGADGWVNKRATDEIVEWQAFSRAQRERGKRGGRPRKARGESREKANAKPNAKANGLAMEKRMHNPGETRAKASHSHNQKKECVNRAPARDAPHTHDLDSDEGEEKTEKSPTEGQLTYIRSLCQQRDIPVPDVATASDAAVLIDDLKSGKTSGAAGPPESDEELAARRAEQLRGFGNCTQCWQLVRKRDEKGRCMGCVAWSNGGADQDQDRAHGPSGVVEQHNI